MNPSLVGFLLILAVSQVSISTSTTLGNIVTSTSLNKSTYSPHFTGSGPVQDIGKISYITNPNSFSWNTTKSQSLSLGMPSLVMATATASLVSPTFYKNSTLTQFRFSGFASTKSTSQYFITLSFKPQGYSAKISIDGSVGTLTTLRIPFVANGTTISYTSPNLFISAGNEEFSWSDIPTSFSPTFNNVSNMLSVTLQPGNFHIDPLAIDGTGHCATSVANHCAVSLTTSNSPDVIIVIQGCFSGSHCGGYSISDTSSLSWTLRLCVGSGGNTCASVAGFDTVAEYYAIASGTLSGDSITCTQTGNVNGRISCIAFGISGANTASPFDSNGAVPCSNSDGGVQSMTFSCSISTSNANDIILGDSSSSTTGTGKLSAGAGFTLNVCNGSTTGDSSGSACNDYDIVSATQSGLSVSITSTTNDAWAFIGDAVKQSGGTVSQGIQITTANGATSATISISGCAVSNATFTANGNVKHYTSITSSCTITLTEPADGSCVTLVSTCTRYRWDISPKPTTATAITFSTCSSGTCTTYQNTTYYQLLNNYTEIAQSPNKWDGGYDDFCHTGPFTTAFCNGHNSPTGTYVGIVLTSSSTTDMCVKGNGGSSGEGFGDMFTLQGNNIGACWDISFHRTMWGDYNMALCLPARVGNTWLAQAPNCFTDTTAANVHSTNYNQSSGGSTPNLWPVAGVGLMFLVAMAYFIKRR